MINTHFRDHPIVHDGVMEWTYVNSTCIVAIGYDGRNLAVEFVGGRVYLHPGVPASVYRAFLGADSHGRFYNQEIRGRYG